MLEFLRNTAKAIWIKPRANSVGPDRNRIPFAAMQFHPSSYADPRGRVFSVGQELFRGVSVEGAPFCAKLFEAGIVAALMEKELLVPTTRSIRTADGFAIVLEHARLPYVSYPFEWTAEMLRIAALHTLTLLEELAGHGLTLKDAHGWNVVFQNCRPLFVDFGSIVEANSNGAWLEYVEQEFREYFLHPLEMMAAGHGRIVRTLLRDFDRGIGREECQAIIASTGRTLPIATETMSFAWYRERINALSLRPASNGWVGYYDGEFPALKPDASWTPKHHAVHRLLQQYRPTSVLDVGANRGWYAMLAASGGAQVAAFDNDEICVDQLFADVREARLSVQPLVMSCLNPAPRHGMAAGVTHSAEERLRSDMVLGLALVHHMVFKMNLNFDQIAAGLAAYTRKTLIVEFPPHDDIHVSQWMTPRYAWYTVENLQTALRKYFPKIVQCASHPAPRVLLVCDR